MEGGARALFTLRMNELRVKSAGDELVIGPVSSQFAARAVLGMIEARLN